MYFQIFHFFKQQIFGIMVRGVCADAPNLYEKFRYHNMRPEVVKALYKPTSLRFWWESEQYLYGRLHGTREVQPSYNLETDPLT